MQRRKSEDRVDRFGETGGREATRPRPPAWVAWSMWAAIVVFTVAIGVVSMLGSST